MRFLFLIVLVLSLFSKSLVAQESYIKERFNTKIGFCKYPVLGQGFPLKKYTPCFEIETNYGISEFLEFGAYLGYSQYKEIDIVIDNPNHFFSDSRPLTFYGLNLNVQLLPIFIKKDSFWLDLYLSSKVGGFYYWNASTFTQKKKRFDYGIYGGLAVHPFKHWGGFVEYGYGNYVQWRSGLSFNF